MPHRLRNINPGAGPDHPEMFWADALDKYGLALRRDVKEYLQLFRLGNAVMGAVGVVVACFMAAGTDLLDHWQNILIAAVVVFMFICGGNALNDYIDHEIDRTAHPERPIPSGRMERRSALVAALVMLLGSVAVSLLTLDVACILIVVVACALMFAYETALKQRGFVGNVTIAVLTGLMFILGGAVVGDVSANVIIGLMAMLVSVGREIAKDIEDMDSDEGRSTLPMRIGVRNASVVACVFFVAGPILSALPLAWQTYGPLFYLVVLADLMFVYCAVRVFRDPHGAQRTAKAAMVVALVAFILGVFRFRGRRMRADGQQLDGSFALLLVDIQRKFVAETEGLSRSMGARLGTVNDAILAFRSAGLPVAYIRYDGSGGCLSMEVEDPEGLVDGLLPPVAGDGEFHKTGMNSFHGTGLDGWLRERGADSVLIAGLVAHLCVLATYFGAFDRGFDPYLLEGGIAATDEENVSRTEAIARTVRVGDLRGLKGPGRCRDPFV